MSDFWGLSTGGDATEDVSTSYEVASGSFEAFPEGTKLLAMVTDAEWRVNDQTGLENLSLTWTVVKPEEVANRKVFQSLWLTDLQPEAKDPEKKRDKARRMFAAICPTCCLLMPSMENLVFPSTANLMPSGASIRTG